MNWYLFNAGNAPFKIILYVTGGRFPQQYNGTFYGIAHCNFTIGAYQLSNGAPCGAWYYRTSNFNFFSGILWTAVGFYLIKFIAFLILSGKIASQEIGSLLVETPEGTKKTFLLLLMPWHF